MTESLERELRRPGQRVPWYETQQEHLLGWLRDYDGPGYYGRAKWDRTAAFVYNHFNCAPGLLWIAEAAGASRPMLLKAKRAVLAAGPRNPAQSAAVRRVFPWPFVEALLEAGGDGVPGLRTRQGHRDSASDSLRRRLRRARASSAT